jgi:metal-responsive CopG/Arc/MetJ family transcriptional regulator
MEQKQRDYKRLQFDFSIDAVNKLDNLVKSTDAISRAEVVRNALRLYDLIMSWQIEGHKVEILKDDEKYIIPFTL